MTVINASSQFEKKRELADRMRAIGIDRQIMDEIMSNPLEAVICAGESLKRQSDRMQEIRNLLYAYGDNYPLYTITMIRSVLGDK